MRKHIEPAGIPVFQGEEDVKAKVMSPVAAWGDWPPPLMGVFAGEAGQRWSPVSRRRKEVSCVPRHS